MHKYTVRFVRSARKDVERLPDSALQRVFRRIADLANTPRPQNSRKLRGARDVWRIRIGAYRVIYLVDDLHHVVEIRAVGDRKDIYN